MVRLLRENPLLVLFVVAGLGFLLGRVRLFGVSLGIAAVLFAGLAVGALDPALALPELIPLLGLVLFVYTIGIASGPGFFASLSGRGLRDIGLGAGMIVLAGVLTAVAMRVLHLDGARGAGLFSGASTNTPALAAALDAMRARGGGDLTTPVVAYSIAYPAGVLASLAAVVVMRPLLQRTIGGPQSQRVASAIGEQLENVTVRIARATTIAALPQLHVAFGRMRRGEQVRVAREDDVLESGDLVTIVGPRPALERAIEVLGERAAERLDLDRREVDYRRIFVSDPRATRRPLRELAIGRRFDAVITRLRRGDVELLPDGATELELGDRIRVIAPRERLPEVSRFFGDSYKALSEIDIITFSLGIALGLLLGRVPIPLPNGSHFELGLAGGPLLAGLVLGRLGRIGPLVFTPPYSASMTLRQLGLVLFLAGVGTRAGWQFAKALASGAAWPILGAAALITFVVSSATLAVGHLMLRIPRGVLLGVLSGAQTQPAVLAFATSETGDEVPNAGYATVFPIATIAKIVAAQILLGLS